MLLPLTPLQSRSERQSSATLQIFTHVIAVPEIASQIEPSGHSSVVPVLVQAFVQYPPGMVESHVSPSSQSSTAAHVPPTFGESPPHATSTLMTKARVRMRPC